MQMEIDYKAECGDAIESLGSSIKEETNGTGIRRYAKYYAETKQSKILSLQSSSIFLIQQATECARHWQ